MSRWSASAFCGNLYWHEAIPTAGRTFPARDFNPWSLPFLRTYFVTGTTMSGGETEKIARLAELVSNEIFSFFR